MKALVINLASAEDRLALQCRQLQGLGISWERLPAITPAELSPPADDPYWHRWQRPLRDTEKALALSHRAAWKAVAAGGEPVLILEDDALLSGRTPDLLAQIETGGDIGRVNLETRGRRKLMGRAHGSLPLRRLVQDFSGAAAYIVWPDGARTLIGHMDAVAGLSDAMLNECRTLPAWQAVPALAVQVDMCARYGVTPPIPVHSSVATPFDRPSMAPFSPAERARFQLRRIGAQVGQGLRRVAHLGRAQREEVPFAP